MSTKNVIALYGVAAILIAATPWSSTQEKGKPQQPKSQVALEKEYYGLIIPRLEQLRENLDAFFRAGRASRQDVLEVRLELLFAKWRCGKVSREQFDAESKRMGKQATAFLRREGGQLQLKTLMRLDWFAVFGKADLNTPVGIPPWAISLK